MDFDDEVIEDEDLDLDSSDEADFSLRHQLATSFSATRFGKTLEAAKINEPMLQSILIGIKEMETISGDADPTVSDRAQDVVNSLIALFLDLKNSPGKFVVSAINAMESKEQKLKAIKDLRGWLDQLEENL